jgi:hypothetical protein
MHTFKAVPLTETPSGILTDGLWHCIQICHSTGKRPFGSCMLNVYIDGQRTMECTLRYPMAAGDVWSHCYIGVLMNNSYTFKVLNFKFLNQTVVEE